MTAMPESDAIATVIALHEAASAATVACDRDAFLAHLAPEAAVNSPGERVLPHDGVAKAFDLGLIDYAACRTTVEHAAVRPNGEVLLMGAEEVEPRGKTADAGRTVSRRFTEVWRPEGDGWLLALRQATNRIVR